MKQSKAKQSKSKKKTIKHKENGKQRERTLQSLVLCASAGARSLTHLYHCYLVIIIKSDRLFIDHNRNKQCTLCIVYFLVQLAPKTADKLADTCCHG